jgi:hypothetical protein
MQEIDKILEDLQAIKKVDSPDYLFTRIEAKIKGFKQERVNFKIVALTAVSFILLCIININAIKKQKELHKQEPVLHNSINIIPDNQLY